MTELTQQRKEQETADWLDYWELDESTGDYKNDTMRAFSEGWQGGRSSLESENAELRARIAELEPLQAFTDALRNRE